MSVVTLISELEALGIELWENNGELNFRAPKGVLNDALKMRLKQQKQAVIEFLAQDKQSDISHDAEAENDPFPLTDIQSAYLIGRSTALPYGGMPCQAYMELEIEYLNLDQFESTLNQALKVHPALRARFFNEGYQEVQAETGRVTVQCYELDSIEALEMHRQSIRHNMLASYQQRDEQGWPLFQISLTRLADRILLHALVDLLMADFVSFNLLINQVIDQANGVPADPPASIHFRDIVIADRQHRQGSRYRKAQQYWLNKLNDFPLAADLPMDGNADPFAPVDANAFSRIAIQLDQKRYESLSTLARNQQVTLTVILLSAYTEVLRRWSRRKDFSLIITMMNRPPLHDDIHKVMGDFTSTLLLDCSINAQASFSDNAHTLQQRLWEGLDHGAYSGVELLREIARKKGRDAAFMPVVFTSSLGASSHAQSTQVTLTDGITWTPQVWLDCQVLETNGQVYINWDYRHGVIPDQIVQDMFAAFNGLLQQLGEATETETVFTQVPVNPARSHNQDKPSPYGGQLLHHGFLQAVKTWPEQLAVVSAKHSLTYQQLYAAACHLATNLDALGASNLIGVAMEKGQEQVIAVLGIMMTGRAYVPIDISQPQIRKTSIIEDAGLDTLLTQNWLETQERYDNVQTIAVIAHENGTHEYQAPNIACTDTAYIIYTSGTTGKPKGVVISHQAAANTVMDINARIHLNDDDVVLGLANLSFDLSVYDIFGTLATGARLILPDPAYRSSPAHWCQLINQYRVSVWNSVPAQAMMLYDYAQLEASIDSLRTMLLSGDWISVSLTPNLHSINEDLTIISLGGATEAAIWSIWHPITEADSQRLSVPYGLPLTGQDIHIFDKGFQECPVGVIGEIFISGMGLATEYFNDPEKTAKHFFLHPVNQQRLYRTGDMGRYMANGEIEFLGREDQQIKIRGHRIELEEIASVLEQHPDILSAALIYSRSDQENNTSGKNRLAAFVVPEKATDSEQREREQSVHALNRLLEYNEQELSRHIVQAPLLELVEQLDQLAKRYVLHLIYEHFKYAPWQISDVCNSLHCLSYYERLVQRWTAVLLQSGLIEAGDQQKYHLSECARQQLACDFDKTWQTLENLATQCHYPLVLLHYFRQSMQQIAAQVCGETDPVELFFPQGNSDIALATFKTNPLAEICNQLVAGAVTDICSTVNDYDETCRIIEIGMGTASTTGDILSRLHGLDYEYIGTDISNYYLSDAAAANQANPNFTSAHLDILKDPAPQGFTSGQFDIVICSDVLHALVDIPSALDNIARILKPGGWLVLLEATREHSEALVSLEFMLPLQHTDGQFTDIRSKHGRTFLTVDEWRELLQQHQWCMSSAFPGAELSSAGLQLMVARQQSALSSISPAQLNRYLSNRLPSYMQPDYMEVLEQLPLSANGKIDRAQLNARLTAPVSLQTHSVLNLPSGKLSDSEQWMAAIWAKVLDCEITHSDARFFDLGGDSLTAARLAGQVLADDKIKTTLEFDEVLRHLMEGLSLGEFVSALGHRSIAPLTDTVDHEKTEHEDPLSPNINIRRGISNNNNGYVLLSTLNTGSCSDETLLDDLAAELVMSGQVIEIRLHAFSDIAAATRLLDEALGRMSTDTIDQLTVTAKSQDTEMLVTFIQQLNLRHSQIDTHACLILDESMKQINSHSTVSDDFITCDLDIFISQTLSQTMKPDVESIVTIQRDRCLGDVNMTYIPEDDQVLDFLLDWFDSHSYQGEDA